MSNLKIFENTEFGRIRTQVIDDKPMFCLSDVCNALGITNVGNVKSRLDEEGIRLTDTLTKGGTQQMLFVTESGLYEVIIRSDSPKAKPFIKWVTSVVLPSIRKNGGYIMNQETLTPEQIVANALVVAQKNN